MVDGQYYYRPHRSQWGIWRYHVLGRGQAEGDFVRDVATKEEASREVYRLNKWKQ